MHGNGGQRGVSCGGKGGGKRKRREERKRKKKKKKSVRIEGTGSSKYDE
jgi:hypothetical protein